MNFSAGPPHRDPFWLTALISAGIGATGTTIAYVLNDVAIGSIWQIMALGGTCAALGACGFRLILSLCNKIKDRHWRVEGKLHNDFRIPY